MQIPVRLTLLLRPSVSPGILLAVGFSTFVLGATPFLLDLVAESYGIGLAAASLIGVLQLGGFVIGSWGSGRFLQPRRRVFIAALVLALLANLASVALPPFAVLVGLRFLSGLSLGLISWFAWVQVFGDDQRMGDVAVMGPVTGILAGPLIALFAAGGGARAIFIGLTALAVVPLLFNRGTTASEEVPDAKQRSSPVTAAKILLACLTVFTLGGSSVFQYAVVLGGDRHGLEAAQVAMILSANAVAAIPSARWPWRRGVPGPWLIATGICAVAMCLAPNPVVFGAGVIFWGFAFWMGIPGVFKVLAERSANPADRAGDAQAVMAGGRVLGPLMGGLLLDNYGATALGIVGGSMMMLAGLTVFAMRSLVKPAAEQPAPA